MLLDNPFKSDARVEKEAISLIQNGYEVEVYAETSNDLEFFEIRHNIKITRNIDKSIHRPISKEYFYFKNKFVSEVKEKDFDILHCHDYKMFLLGVEIKKQKQNIKLIYDSHEYLAGWPFYKEIKSFKGKVKGWYVWQWFVNVEKAHIKYADKIITISEGIAEEMMKSLNLLVKPIVIRNIPNEFPISSEKYFHNTFNIPETTKIIVNSGNLYFGDKRTKMLFDSIKEIDNTCLLFIGNTAKHKELKNKIENHELKNKIFIHDYVASNEIGKLISNADIGIVHTWQPKWKSHWHSLPNRIFEYSMAGLPIVSTSQPEFIRLGNEFNHIVFYNGDEKADFVNALKNCIENFNILKQNALKIKEKISWEIESNKLLDVYNNL